MNFSANINLKDLKLDWRKHIYVLIGILIAGLLIFITFRSFAFLAAQVDVIFQFNEFAPQTPRTGFNMENFEKIKDRIKSF